MKVIKLDIFLCFVFCFFCIACSTSRSAVNETNSLINDTIIKTITKIDTTVIIEPDTAQLRALIECDERGNAYVAQIDELQGKIRERLQAQIKYIYVPDTTGTNGVKRQVYIDVLATCMKQEVTIQQLQEEIKHYQQIATTARKEKKKETENNGVAWFLIGLILGLGIGIYIFK